MKIELGQWLLPGQRPHDWISPTPIDLLPLLRQLYPGCIDEGLLAVQLINPDWPQRTAWHLRVTSVRGDGLVDITPVSQDSEDCYNFSDWPPQEFPDGLLEALCKPDRVAAWQATIELFRPEAFDMLRRVQNAAEESAAEESVRPYAARQAFLRDVATLLASNAAESVDLLQSTVRALQSSEPSGMHGYECDSLWAELGAEAHTPSLLHQRYLDDLKHKVWSKLCELPRATQIAVWFKARADEDFPRGGDTADWEAPDGRIESMHLSGMDDYCRGIAAKIMRLAEQNYLQAREGG